MTYKNIEIYLPFFSWFYESIHKVDTSSFFDDEYQELINNPNVNDMGFNSNDLKKILETKGKNIDTFCDIWDKYYKLDIERYKQDYSKKYTEQLVIEYKDILEQLWITNIKYKGLSEPWSYNFSTDKIDILVDYNPNKIKTYLLDNKETFQTYISENNRSRDGFISNIPENFEEYIKEDWDRFQENKLTQIIEFAIINEDWWTINEIDENIFNSINDLFYVYNYVIKL